MTAAPSSTAGQCLHGWQYGAYTDQILLCPDACEKVKADPGAGVDVLLGCSTIDG